MKGRFLILICFGCMMLAVPFNGQAFDTQTFGNDSSLTIWGFLRNYTGMFTQNPNPWGAYEGQSGNQLATERTSLRTYFDWKVNEQLRFWLASQFTYEPWYAVEKGANVMKNGNEYSEYKNVNDILREVYVEWKPNKKNSIKVGRMNVIWGETLTGRVGDVVNPMDIRWSLPMSMEPTDDQRIPQYMIRGIHDIDLLSSSFEWIVSPIITSPEWSVTRAPGDAANLITGTAGQRFSPAPEMADYWNRSLHSDVVSSDRNAHNTSPMTGAWSYIPSMGGWFPGTITSTGLVTEGSPNVKVKLPNGIDDTRFGFRTSTVCSGLNFGFIYYHRQVFEPVMRREGVASSVALAPGVTQITRNYSVEYPDVDNIGFYLNKQLPWPGVIRSEIMYTPNQPFNYFVPTAQPYSTESGVVKRDQLQYLFAYDLRGFIYPAWHKTAPIDVIFEHTGTWIPNARELQNSTIVWYGTKLPTWRGQFVVDASTNWLYDKFETGIAVGYQTFGNAWMMVPRVKWLPGIWNKKFTAELKYVYLDGDRDKDVFGIWKDKSFVQLQTQFNF